MFKHPLITVITVTFNAENVLEKSIHSVINQTYSNIEYIIVDGGSTDHTLDIIKKYDHYITKWISEPDKGIYDAMNKGWKMANGDWIYYLGADDILLNDGLENLIKSIENNTDIIYGNIIYDKIWGKEEKIAYPAKQLKTVMCCSHQAAIMKREVIEKLQGFNTEYSIIADFDLFQRAYLNGYIFKHINHSIAIFCMKGLSSYNLSLEFERYKIMKRNKSTKYPCFTFIYLFTRKVLSILRFRIRKSLLKTSNNL